jgi:hypothetical protein
MMVALLQIQPRVGGVVFDLPETARDEAALDEQRIQFVAGSYFESVPVGDVYLLSGILHDWGCGDGLCRGRLERSELGSTGCPTWRSNAAPPRRAQAPWPRRRGPRDKRGPAARGRPVRHDYVVDGDLIARTTIEA